MNENVSESQAEIRTQDLRLKLTMPCLLSYIDKEETETFYADRQNRHFDNDVCLSYKQLNRLYLRELNSMKRLIHRDTLLFLAPSY